MNTVYVTVLARATQTVLEDILGFVGLGHRFCDVRRRLLNSVKVGIKALSNGHSLSILIQWKTWTRCVDCCA